jgi:hypothetical protein
VFDKGPAANIVLQENIKNWPYINALLVILVYYLPIPLAQPPVVVGRSCIQSKVQYKHNLSTEIYDLFTLHYVQNISIF